MASQRPIRVFSSQNGQIDRAQGRMRGSRDSLPIKSLADKSLPRGDRSFEREINPSGWHLRSFLIDYIEAKRKAAQEDCGGPPWWTTFR